MLLGCAGAEERAWRAHPLARTRMSIDAHRPLDRYPAFGVPGVRDRHEIQGRTVQDGDFGLQTLNRDQSGKVDGDAMGILVRIGLHDKAVRGYLAVKHPREKRSGEVGRDFAEQVRSERLFRGKPQLNGLLLGSVKSRDQPAASSALASAFLAPSFHPSKNPMPRAPRS